MRYKVQGAEVDENGEADIPEGMNVIGAMYHPTTFKLLIVCLRKVKEEEEPPEESPEEPLGKKVTEEP